MYSMNDSEFVRRQDRTYLMGLAILFVFIYHLPFFANIYRGFGNINAFSLGYLGVEVFFLLSTYGLGFSAEKNGWKTFFIHRLKRLYPLYLFYIVLVYVLFLRNENLVNIIFLQCSGLSSIKILSTGMEWYTPALTLVYLFFPLFYLIGKWISNYKWWYSAIAINMVMLIAYYMQPYVDYVFTGRFPIIACGVILYFWYRNNQNKKVLPFIFFLVMEVFVLNNCFMLSIFVLLFVWLFKFVPQRPFSTLVNFCGRWSYELYLAQSLTTLYFMKTCSMENVWLLMLSTFLVTLPVFLVFTGVSKLSRKYLWHMN